MGLPRITRWNIFRNFGGQKTAEKLTAALDGFYGEKFDMPVARNDDTNLSSRKLESLPTELSVENVWKTLVNECNAEVSKYLISVETNGKSPCQLVLHLGTSRERVSLAETLIRKYRKCVNVGYEGLNAKEADWIVIDLKICAIHIFDPQTRLDYAIDDQLRQESDSSPQSNAYSASHLLQQFAESVPRRMKRL